MIEIIFIVGPPGSGKSYGGRTLDHKNTLWINSDKKPLTFLGARKKYQLGGNYFIDRKLDAVRERVLYAYGRKRKSGDGYIFNSAIWDTANASMLDVEMAHKGSMTHNEWYNFAKDVYIVLDGIKDLISRPDTFYLFVLFHEGVDSQDRRNVLTIGRKLNNINLEGMVNWCFFTKVSGEATNPVFELETTNFGTSLAKQCAQTFPALISNDYKKIIKGIEAFNNGEELEETATDKESE